MRSARINRQTKETNIELTIELDGRGKTMIETGIGFFDHMLNLFASHGRFDLVLNCKGDLEVDGHHTVEDIGIALGQAVREALGDKVGITRYASFYLPMDESLAFVALDISGRSYLGFDVEFPAQKVGNFDTELVKEFMAALSRELGMNLHIKMLTGENTHHMIEGIFKCLGRVLRQACAIEEEFADEIPSTKGVL